MSTSPALQTASVKHFLIGLGIGVGAEICISFLFSLVPLLISGFSLDLYLHTFYNNSSNMSALGLVIFFLRWVVLAGLLFLVHKKFKNKLVTVGVASGWVVSMILATIIIPIIFN